MGNNRDFMLAIGLSILVLVAWQYFFGMPELERQRERKAAQQEQAQQQGTTPSAPAPSAPGTAPAPAAGAPTGSGGSPAAPTVPGVVPSQEANRQAALTKTRRIAIETPSLTGSINLTGARIDDLKLNKYRVSVKPGSDVITLLSPTGGPNAYYAEYGWAGDPAAKLDLPNKDTVWQATSGAKLTPQTPVTLTWTSGEGLTFTRTISVDEDYMFTVNQVVENATGSAIRLYPYGLISRHGTPQVQSFYILHEGLVGVLGESGLQEVDYDDIREDKIEKFDSTGGWLGITDKYWAVVLVPDQKTAIKARFSDNPQGAKDIYQTDYLYADGVSVAAGAKAAISSRLFAGAKVVSVVDSYADKHAIENFDLLIDWGWFYFLTKPLFMALDFLFKLFGNFGIAILALTILIKICFLPLANKSYVSMSKMKKLQPEVNKLRERFKDDKARQQQAMMELYKKESVNPMSGCLPILVQIPVFFALYKVLFVTIEMRHAPFFGWIQDLSAPDPTTLFNLFGLIPWTPPGFLMIGVWPLLMGITMWVQMRLNPTPPDPIQAQIFNWMPLIFTFLLAPFPAGLVIYWAWNNLLSIAQQYFIMRRQGVKVELWDNIKQSFAFLNRKQKKEGT